MSKYLRAIPSAGIASTLQGNAIIKQAMKSTAQNQFGSGTTFSPPVVTLGSTASCTVNFNDRDIVQEEGHYIVYDVSNASAVQDCIFKRGPLTHWDQIDITINDSPNKLEIRSLDQLIAIYSDYFMTLGLSVEEITAFFRGEHSTYNGITVANGTDKTFYFWIDPIISFAKNLTRNVLKSLKFDLRATPEPANAENACLLAVSSASTAAFTKANITYKNVRFQRFFTILNDKRLYVSALASGLPVRHVFWKSESVVIRNNATWNAGDSVSFKLSDIAKRKGTQIIQPYVREASSAYNSANAQKEYSGANYITYKTRQLFGDYKVLDNSDQRICKKYEIEYFKNEYGWDKQLPASVWTDSTYGLSRYWLRLTNITFDYMAVEPYHEVVYTTNTVEEDYDISLYCPTGGSLGSSYDVVVNMIWAEEYEFDKNGNFIRI